MLYLISWHDPDDPDHGTSTGFEEFNEPEELVSWLDKKVINSPRLEFTAYQAIGYIEVESVQVATKFRIK